MIAASRLSPMLMAERSTHLLRPELLAPAGDRTCMVAAIENGADAIYFGLQGHNARARAANFAIEELPEIMALLHARGVKGYVTLNTLIFPSELAGVESLVRQVAAAGADAVIVQDIGLARMIRAITPDLEIHGSTQMSITSVEGVKLAAELGCSRVILARELSLKEIAAIRAKSPLPVEVFVHGALCVAYSGQCLTSEALGGRSANRGECAQACRMPYEIVSDGELVPMGDIQYLLSPQDLAAFDLIPQLVEIGVASVKIEGRLKAPEYVAQITRSYRKAIDETLAGHAARFSSNEVQAMEMTFSRGFSHGFFDGNNHKVLVRGDHAKKRGVFLGAVKAILGNRVQLDLAAPIKPGDGVVFDGSTTHGVLEQGGRVYDVTRSGRGHLPVPSGLAAGTVELGFGHRDIDLKSIHVGQRIWKTDDPELARQVRSTYEGHPHRLVHLNVQVFAHVGQRLRFSGTTTTGFSSSVESDDPLGVADRLAATEETIREGMDRLGGTIYRLANLSADIEGGPMVPKSLVNRLRRDLVAALDVKAATAPTRMLAEGSVLPNLRPTIESKSETTSTTSLSALCRTVEQAVSAVVSGADLVYLDFADIKAYKHALGTIREHSASVPVFLATPRIQKPREAPIFRFLAMQGAAGLLVRNAGGLEYCGKRDVPFVADFSMNAANELAVAWLLAKGAKRVTASYDLSFDQLDDLIGGVPPASLEVVIHQHMPMFHMEHCVFCAFLSPGTDKTNCGRPCDHHDVRLRDRVGMDHPLTADVGCRNTLFNAVPQTAAEYLPRLLARGIRHLRVEFLNDTAEEVAATLLLYRGAMRGTREARTLWKDLKATNRYGVTRGQLAVL
jgi:putative protease